MGVEATVEKLQEYIDAQLEIDTKPIFVYGVTKACLMSYTVMTAKALPHIKVSCVYPGYIKTALT